MPRVTNRRVGLAALILWLFVGTSCSMAHVTWHHLRRSGGYVVPKRIPLVVDVSERAHAADHGGYIDTMVLTVREELGEEGVESTILSPKPSHVPSPRVEIIVRTFDEGDATDSYITGLLTAVPTAGYMDLAVICRAYSASNGLMFEGLVKGSDFGTSNPRDLAEVAGDSIAKALTDPRARLDVRSTP